MRGGSELGGQADPAATNLLRIQHTLLHGCCCGGRTSSIMPKHPRAGFCRHGTMRSSMAHRSPRAHGAKAQGIATRAIRCISSRKGVPRHIGVGCCPAAESREPLRQWGHKVVGESLRLDHYLFIVACLHQVVPPRRDRRYCTPCMRGAAPQQRRWAASAASLQTQRARPQRGRTAPGGSSSQARVRASTGNNGVARRVGAHGHAHTPGFHMPARTRTCACACPRICKPRKRTRSATNLASSTPTSQCCLPSGTTPHRPRGLTQGC